MNAGNIPTEEDMDRWMARSQGLRSHGGSPDDRMGNNKFEDTFITGITPHDSPPMGRGYDPPSTRGFEELSPSEDTGQGLPTREGKGSTGSGLSNHASPRKKSIDIAVLACSLEVSL